MGVRAVVPVLLLAASCASAPLFPDAPEEWRAFDAYVGNHRRELRLRPGDLRRGYVLPTSVMSGGLCMEQRNGVIEHTDHRVAVSIGTRPAISREEVEQLLFEGTGFKVEGKPELYVVLPGVFTVTEPRLAWRVRRWMGGAANALWIDAETGETVRDDPPSLH